MKTRILFILTIVTMLVVPTASAQTLTASPISLAFGTSCILNTNNTIQSYNLSGVLLDGTDISITAPAGFLVSFSQYTGYAATITLSGYSFPTLPARPIYITFAPSSTTAYNVNVTNVGGGASSNVAVTGTGLATALGGTSTTWFRPTGSGNISTMTWEKTTDGGASWTSASAPILNTDSVFIPGNDSLGIDQAAVKGYFKLWISTGKFAAVGSGDFDSLSTVEYPTTGPSKMINISYGNLFYNIGNNDGFSNDATGMYGARIKNNLTIGGSVKAKGCIAAGSGGTYVHKVGGDVLVIGTGNPALSGTDGGTNVNVTWDIGGSLNISGAGCRVLGFASSGTGTVNFKIGKDLIISNGQFSYSSSGTGLGKDTVHIKGNVTITGGLGIIKQAGTPSLTNPWVFDFCGTTEQVITNTTTALVFNKSEGVKIFWNVNNPAGIRFMNDFINYVSLNIIQGTVTMDGASIFSYNIPPASSYAESKLIYSGTTAQSTGAEYPAVNGPNGIEINNPAGVTLSAPRTISGNTVVTLTKGVFDNGSNLSFSGGLITMSGGSFSQAPTFLSKTTTNITYSTPTPAALVTTGYELPDTVRLLTINNTSNVALNAPVVVDSLQLSAGNLNTTATNLLTISSKKANPFVGGSASSFIDGPLANTIATTSSTSKTFPIGKGGAYRPLVLTVTQDAATSTSYTAEVFNSAPPSRSLALSFDKVSTMRYWNIAKTAGANVSTASVKLDYGSDDGVTDAPNLRIAGDDGVNWVDLGGSGSAPTAGNITSTNPFTALGIFTFGDNYGGGNPLPVQMTSFTTNIQGLTAELFWKTATETDNYGFEIERRAMPEGSWKRIGFVAGAGTCSSPREYSYVDKNLTAGKYTYRLKQIDNDGTFKYSLSAEGEVVGMQKVLKLVGNFPNPFNPSTKVQFTVPENGHTRLRIYNLIGQEVANLFDGPAIAGDLYTAKFDASAMPSGLYFSVLEFGNQRLTSKMMLTK